MNSFAGQTARSIILATAWYERTSSRSVNPLQRKEMGVLIPSLTRFTVSKKQAVGYRCLFLGALKIPSNYLQIIVFIEEFVLWVQVSAVTSTTSEEAGEGV
jgi:hypothetical protein